MNAVPVNPKSEIRNPKSERLFTFASGGWVLLLTLIGCAVVAGWALAPAIMRGQAGRPPGDGVNIESFNFDLSNLAVPRELVVPAMLYRGMVPVMFEPTHSGLRDDEPGDQPWEAMQRKNDPKYGKYLVPADPVIGVTIDGESRAYPLHVLNVHEIVNDTLGGTPIAVTYNWPCASTMVFDRRINSDAPATAEFGVSGLVYNSNLLMYDRNPTRGDADAPDFGAGNETLWCQLTGRPISGSESTLKSSLTIIPCDLTTWADWVARHPDTTVLDRNLKMFERYKDAAPTQYFKSDKILFPVSPMVSQQPLTAKSPVLAVMTSEASRVYPVQYVLHVGTPIAGASAEMIEWTDTLGGRTLRFIGDRKADTLRVECSPPDQDMFTVNALWFAWHAMHPDDALYQPGN